MFGTIHGLLGILIGLKIKSPVWALLLGISSHFLLDALPHGDQRLLAPGEWPDKKRLKKNILICAADAFVFWSLVIILIQKTNLFQLPIIFAVFGALIPDFVLIFSQLVKSRFSYSFIKFHNQTLHWWARFNFSQFLGYFLQAIIFLLILSLIV